MIKEKLEKYKLQIGLIAAFVLVFLVGLGTGKYSIQKPLKVPESQLHYTTPVDTKTPATNMPEAEVAGATDAAAIETGTVAVSNKNTADTTNVNTPSKQKTASNKRQAGDLGTTTNCPVKGNISSTGNKIYHVVGGAFYARVKPEQCFNDEATAKAAGFRKSSR